MEGKPSPMTGPRVVAALIVVALLAIASGPARAQVAVPMNDRDGDNTIFFTWDADAGRVTHATSGRRIVAGQQVELITSISDEDGRVVMRATLHNSSETTTFQVDGRLKHRIMVDGDVIRTSKSRPLERTLRPGEKVRARFDLRLPSGDYEGRTDYSAD